MNIQSSEYVTVPVLFAELEALPVRMVDIIFFCT